MSRSRSRFVSLTMAVLLTGCPDYDEPRPIDVFPVGEPLGIAVEARIGAEGGRLELADRSIVVTVPPGAVDAPTVFRIEEITRTAPHGNGHAYRLSPHGRTFAAPVEIAFTLPGGPPVPDALVAAYQDAGGAWIAVHDVAVDHEAGTLTARTTHFSDWTYAEAFRIQPEATVKVGEGVSLPIQSCLYDEHRVDEDLALVSLVRTCRDFTLRALVRRPSVNGIEGGNAEVGVVTNDGSLFYVAPSAVPATNPVAVSASIDLLGRRSELLLVSHVTVIEDEVPDVYEGEASYRDSDGFVYEAEVTWTPLVDHGEVVAYRPSGFVTATVPNCTVTPATAPIAFDDGEIEIDSSYDPPRDYGGGTSYWTATLECPESDPTSFVAGGTWWATPEPRSASSDGAILEGSDAWWSWSFRRVGGEAGERAGR